MDALDQTPLHAKHYADDAEFVCASILENVRLARSTYRLRFGAPGIARRVTPGQFVMVRLAGLDDPLLGRALALYDCDPAAGWVDVVYLAHGKFTTALATRQPGDRVEVWGPLGNGFKGDGERLDRLIAVAGGIGYTPFLAVAREALGAASYGESPARSPLSAEEVTFCYGVRTADLLAGEADFGAAGVDLRVASDDGSVGHQGLVTEVLRQALEETASGSRRVLVCGPEPMMQAAAEICAAAGVRCDASLETPMACGLGVCFSCVARVKQPDGGWDYKRTCVEGPVFDASQIAW
ncbi:dihydroorotate dehydrogenase electron transfer subunit [Botrimarina sp.]|uniref:dihydroorotate dehydrogenase electron transfer subunit n=1 Tax=Botrimarina sp. TaxID=2795802 RepID=UPI0032EEBE25